MVRKQMKHQYQVQGMHCESCVTKVASVLEKIPGVTRADVTLTPPRAGVEMREHVTVERMNSALQGVGTYRLEEEENAPEVLSTGQETVSRVATYFPLILIALYLIGGVVLRELSLGRFEGPSMMSNFMGGFFTVFSFFKILDLRGFAEGYATYDIIAQKYPEYGKIYPFIELFLGILYLFANAPFVTSLLTVIVMGVSSVGVIKSIRSRRQIQCACLGTFFQLPLTNITLFEDLLMVAMAVVMLVV